MFVAYLRVSTQRQGISGLGLEAQHEAVQAHSKATAQPIIATFTEVESGASKHRPQLAAAIELCRRRKAVLLIARLDRLSRSLAFIAQLLEANIEIRAADVPEANRLMLQMLAVFAEHERRLISDRTRAALAAAKIRGVVLGKQGAVLGAQNRAHACAYAEKLRPTIVACLAGPKTTAAALAEQLNRKGIPSREGGRWHATNVGRLLGRLNLPVAPPD